MGLSVLLRGTEQQKLKWTFDLYDVNKDGYVTKEVTVGNTGGLVGWGHPDGDLPAPCVPQDMLEIMKSIYAMMGHCTEPALGASAPAQHVELFFQVRQSPLSPPGATLRPGVAPLSPGHSLAEDGQEQGRRGDFRGVPGHVPGGEGLLGAPSFSCLFCPKMTCWGHQERGGQRGHPGRDGSGTGEAQELGLGEGWRGRQEDYDGKCGMRGTGGGNEREQMRGTGGR